MGSLGRYYARALFDLKRIGCIRSRLGLGLEVVIHRINHVEKRMDGVAVGDTWQPPLQQDSHLLSDAMEADEVKIPWYDYGPTWSSQYYQGSELYTHVDLQGQFDLGYYGYHDDGTSMCPHMEDTCQYIEGPQVWGKMVHEESTDWTSAEKTVERVDREGEEKTEKEKPKRKRVRGSAKKAARMRAILYGETDMEIQSAKIGKKSKGKTPKKRSRCRRGADR